MTDLTKSMDEVMKKVVKNKDEIEDITIESLSLEERFIEMVYTEGGTDKNARVHV